MSTNRPEDPAHRSIVGRVAQRETIAAALAGCSQRRGEVLLLCGEPGIGKSTLAQWAAECAQQQGVAVHWGLAWESGGAPSYWPWIQLLRSLLAEREVRAQLEARAELAAPLAQLLPELGSTGSSAPRPELQAAEARFRLMEAMRGTLELFAVRGPQLLILEDLHAADADSLRLFHYVARHLSGLPLLLLGTFREVEARAVPEKEPLWQAARHGRVLRLPRMTEAEVREFVAARRPDFDETRLRSVLGTSEGNPLFLSELVDLLAERDASALERTLLPDTLAQVIREQLERLPEETHAMLAVAATLGRDFAPDDLALLGRRSAEEVVARLEPALRGDVIRPAGKQGFRFAHILIRDALHHGLQRGQREALHLRCAEMLRLRVEHGEPERWTELATHLQEAGPAQRDAAVEAWLRAAQHAREQLAFEAAVEALGRALELFGAGPRAEPQRRCALLLDLAEATLVKGDVDAGRARCAEAYRIAQLLEDAALMARAALTYGSAFVVAKVDRELVEMLRETLERLSGEDRATRARITARLAAALQPAPEPMIPMQMAREAIALARQTGDQRVLYETLRSAISALMDFAPADERIALNREYTRLAERFRDVPEQFRGHLRLMVDALELGDRHEVERAIEVCDGIARRVALPHYAWKVASARALVALLRGELDAAERWVDEAEALASRAGDASARLTLPIQRFGLLRERASDALAAVHALEPELLKGIVRFPFAEPFVMPRVASFLYEAGEREAAEALLRDDLLEIARASGDRSSLCAIGEIALCMGDAKRAREIHDALGPHGAHCSHWGLMGMLWDGPVAHVMGRLAAFLGQPAQARALLEQALAIAERMQARPESERIRRQLAELARPEVAASRPSAPAQDAFEMRLEGELWCVTFRDRSALIRATRGMEILHRLVSDPGREFHVLDLEAVGRPAQADAGPLLDERARAAYREQLVELESDLALAEELGDPARAEQARGAIELLTRELSRAFGLGGRARPAGAAAERARVNVQRRLRDARQRIGAHLPEAARFLEKAIRTGAFCTYDPS